LRRGERVRSAHLVLGRIVVEPGGRAIPLEERRPLRRRVFDLAAGQRAHRTERDEREEKGRRPRAVHPPCVCRTSRQRQRFCGRSSVMSESSPLLATWTWMRRRVPVGVSNAPMARPIQSFSTGSQNSDEPHVAQKPRRTFSDERYHVTFSPPCTVTAARG